MISQKIIIAMLFLLLTISIASAQNIPNPETDKAPLEDLECFNQLDRLIQNRNGAGMAFTFPEFFDNAETIQSRASMGDDLRNLYTYRYVTNAYGVDTNFKPGSFFFKEYYPIGEIKDKIIVMYYDKDKLDGCALNQVIPLNGGTFSDVSPDRVDTYASRRIWNYSNYDVTSPDRSIRFNVAEYDIVRSRKSIAIIIFCEIILVRIFFCSIKL